MSILKAMMKGTPVTPDNFRLGLRVRRGPDWCWDDQDHDDSGKPGLGTIVPFDSPDRDLDHEDYTNDAGKRFQYTWCKVRWDGGFYATYRISPQHELSAVNDTKQKKQ